MEIKSSEKTLNIGTKIWFSLIFSYLKFYESFFIFVEKNKQFCAFVCTY